MKSTSFVVLNFFHSLSASCTVAKMIQKTPELQINGKLHPSQQDRCAGGRPGPDQQAAQEEEASWVPPVASVQPLAQVSAAGQRLVPAEVAVCTQPGLRAYVTSRSFLFF